MSHSRVAFALALLSIVAASNEPVPAAWPVAAGWPKSFPTGDVNSLVMGDSRVLAIEPAQLSALDWTDGTLLWKSALTATTRPVTDDGRVFISAGDAIHALAETTGVEQWRLPVGRISIAPTARGGWLIVAAEDGSLQGINAAQGREVWRIALPAPLTSPAAIDGELVFGPCADGVIRAWQISDGALRWTREIGTRPSQVRAASGHVFVGGEDGHLISVRQRDGRLNWAYDLEMPIVGRLASDEEHVYASTIDNSVHAHNFNGHQAWHQLLAARVVDGIFSDSGSVFVPQSNGEIRIFLAKDGKRAGRLPSLSEDAAMIGGLVAGGTGDQLRMAITVSAGGQLTMTTYRRTGIAAVPATSAPAGTPLLLSLPGGRP